LLLKNRRNPPRRTPPTRTSAWTCRWWAARSTRRCGWAPP